VTQYFILRIAAASVLIAPALCQAPLPAALPRTPDSHPDFQGVWTSATIVPLERPAGLKDKEFYTEQEAAEYARKMLGRSTWERLGSQAPEHYNMSQYGLDLGQEKLATSLRTSMIVGPEGRIPPLTPDAQKRIADRAARNRGHQFDSYENRPLQERCLLYASEGPPMTPWTFNSNLQIIQEPAHVAVLQEMIHSARIIPLDGSPHLPANIRQWMGDSRGHWEGETLVVDTTNFTDKTSFHGSTAGLHVVERFTLFDRDTIIYRFTVDDPATWVRPWTAELRFARIARGRIFEFACHEGNLGLANTLSGARAREKAPEEATRKGSK
jgi:hypothetical protein